MAAKKERNYSTGAIMPWDKALSKMKYKDLKKECIMRGMPFDDVLQSDIHGLRTYFINKYYDARNKELVTEFDDYLETLIKDNTLIHPTLRLDYLGKESKKKPKAKLQRKDTPDKPKVKKKSEKTELGVRAGTKKSLTFELANKGMDIDKIIKTVMAKFPEANEKSIKIWAKKARN